MAEFKMDGIKTEPVDFVKEFQEYLSQQTQHVNMISGSVCREKEAAMEQQAYSSNMQESQSPAAAAAAAAGAGVVVDHSPAVDMGLALGDAPDLQIEGLERTGDGKYKCNYCSYSNKGMARLIEHIRIHTGEKPHRCQLCPFASAYERHLEAHMRSHTGEKPYKCDQCSFRCSDRSNLSHHRRRRHKVLPARVPLRLHPRIHTAALQKRQNALGYARRMVFNYNNPLQIQKHNYVNEFSRDFRNIPVSLDESQGCVQFPNTLNQLSGLSQVSNATPDSSENLRDEKPIIIQQISSQANNCTSSIQTSSSPSPTSQNCSPTPGLSFENPAHSHENSPEREGADEEAESDQRCGHCDIQFSDNVLFTIHMGSHGYEQPFRCNVCGHLCRDKYDFACHFARGQHRK